MSAPPSSTAPAEAPDVPPAVPDPVEAAGFAWWSPFAAWVVANAVGIVLVSILFGLDADGEVGPAATVAAVIVQDVLLIVAMVAVARATGARADPGAFGLRRVPPARAVGFAVLAAVVFFGFLLLWSEVADGAEQSLLDDLGAQDSTLALVAFGVLVAIVAPIVEELFFRGFLFGALNRAMTLLPAVLIAGVAFGLVHAATTPPILLVPLAVLGCLLCLLYRRTGSLLPGMGVHAFNNAIAFGVSLSWTADQVAAVAVAAPVIVIALAASVSE